MTDVELDPKRERLRAAWRALGRDGFYQDPEYGDLYEATTRHEAVRAIAWSGDAPVGFAQAIVFREGPKLAGSLGIHATIRHGPVFPKAGQRADARALLEGIVEGLRPRVAYLRVYPGRGLVPEGALASAGFKRTAWLNYYVDLSGTEGEILERVSKKRRYGIRKAADRGIAVREAASMADIREAHGLLAATHARVEFPLEPRAFLEEAFERFHPRRLRVFLAELQGRPLATTVVAVDGTAAVNWFAGSDLDPETSKLYPNDAVLWAAISWAKSRGLACFDMGGGGPPENLAGFVDFKRQFGGEEVDVGQYTFVPSEWKLAVAGKGFELLRKIRGMRR